VTVADFGAAGSMGTRATNALNEHPRNRHHQGARSASDYRSMLLLPILTFRSC
jgi:hypothetical protein